MGLKLERIHPHTGSYWCKKILTPMKFNKTKTMSRRKNRKAHFGAKGEERRLRMSSPLSKELREKYGVRSFPIRTNDKVEVTAGKFKGKTGTVVCVRRKKYKVYIDSCEVSKVNGHSSKVGIDASNMRIKELYLEKGRLQSLEKKVNNRKIQMERTVQVEK